MFSSSWGFGPTDATRGEGGGRYLLVAACAALAMMSKPMAVTFPFVLLLLDAWPLNRWAVPPGEGGGRTALRLMGEKVPLLLLLLPLAAATFLLHQRAGTLRPVGYGLDLLTRLAHASVSFLRYLQHTFWPADLSVFFPLPHQPPALPGASLAFLVLAGVSVLGWIARRRFPFLLMGWSWFLGMLVPVIGVVPLGWQDYADRFTYLPHAGLFLALVWGGWELARGRPTLRRIALGAFAGTLAILAVASFLQAGVWRDEETLYRRSMANSGEVNWLLANNLGVILLSRGEFAEAERYFRLALEDDPADARARANLARVLPHLGRPEEALLEWEEAISLRPDDQRNRREYAQALVAAGLFARGEREWRIVLAASPRDALAWMGLGAALGGQGRFGEALSSLSEAEAIDPLLPGLQYNLGLALARLGKESEGVGRLMRELEQDPRDEEAARMLQTLLGAEEARGE